MLDAGTGRSCQFRSRSSLSPWKRPASTMMRAPPDSTRYFEPVTVRAAPKKVSVIMAVGSWQFAVGSWQSGEEADLAAGVPEERGAWQLAGAEPRDECGHRFRGVRRIEKDRLAAC